MHTYVWLVFALNIIFKLVWENLPCIMLPGPPLSDTHSQQCLTECNIQLFYHYNKIPSPFFVPPDKNQQSAIISAKPIHSSHFFSTPPLPQASHPPTQTLLFNRSITTPCGCIWIIYIYISIVNNSLLENNWRHSDTDFCLHNIYIYIYMCVLFWIFIWNDIIIINMILSPFQHIQREAPHRPAGYLY